MESYAIGIWVKKDLKTLLSYTARGMGTTTEQLLGLYLQKYIHANKSLIVGKLQKEYDEKQTLLLTERKEIQDKRTELKASLEGKSEKEISENPDLSQLQKEYTAIDSDLRGNIEKERSLKLKYERYNEYLKQF